MFTPLEVPEAERLIRTAPIPRRVGVVEYVVAGGTDPSSHLTAALLPEARAMLAAAVRGFAETPGVEQVRYAIHGALVRAVPGIEGAEPLSCTGPEPAVWELGRHCDALLIVAPEIDNALPQLVALAERVCSRNACLLLNLPAQTCALFGDKVQTYRWLAENNIPAVPHMPAEPERTGFAQTVVVKPRDGAGCEGVQVPKKNKGMPAGSCIAPFIPGLSCSAAALLGPSHAVLLPPSYQWVKVEDGFSYHGGAVPLPDSIAMALQQLLYRLFVAIEPATGFIGIDCVLPWSACSKSTSAAAETALVVEVNPRMTTSIVAQTAATGVNIFGLLLALQHPHDGPEIRALRARRAVTFSPDGSVRSCL